MAESYRQKLFDSYHATHVSHLDTNDSAKCDWFIDYVKKNYIGHLSHLDRGTAQILELACNQGYLLAALRNLGFETLHGIDLSPIDVEKAQRRLPDASIKCIDAATYLDRNRGRFDVIILKALLEHVTKDQVIPLLEQIRIGLAPGGLGIIEVPNMDWLFAQHERYMDFTHEVGFTPESLGQVMRNVFADVTVVKTEQVVGPGFKTKMAAALRPALISVLSYAFRILGDGAADTWWYSRSIIGIGKR